MANKHLKLRDQPLFGRYFMSESEHGISLYRTNYGKPIEDSFICIPWAKIRAALRRKDKK